MVGMFKMIPKRYSQMTEAELHQVIADLKEQSRKAEQLGRINEYAVFEQKITMANAYLLNPEDFHPGEVYGLKDNPGVSFKISYINGVFAWGKRLEGINAEEAFPISMLVKK